MPARARSLGSRCGFTLIEILIVVVILSVLAATVIPQYTDVTTDAKLNTTVFSLQGMRAQLELYRAQHNGNSPPTLDLLTQVTNESHSTAAGPNTIYGPYMLVIPKDNLANINAVAERGRDPGLRLRRGGRQILLRDWANEIFEKMAPGCELLDQEGETPVYGASLQQQRAKIADPDLTPSARMLAEMAANKEEFYHFALRMSRQHQQHFAERPLAEGELQAFRDTASASHDRQRAIEAADRISFASFLEQYFAQT